VPSRVIRGEINSSVSLNRVSIGAELTFDRLITAVDDFGRFDARREMLKAALFPVRADAPPELVMEWIRELASEGCVQLYEVEDRPYLCLLGWEKHRGNQRRRKASVYPDPPRGSSNARKPMPRKSGNPPEVTAGVGVGLGLGDGVGVKRQPATSPPPAPDSEVIESSKTAVTLVEPDPYEPKKPEDAAGATIVPMVAPASSPVEIVEPSHTTRGLILYDNPDDPLALVPEAAIKMLANLLAKRPGTREEHEEFLRGNLDLMAAELEIDGQPTMAKLKRLVFRWHAQEIRNPGGKTPQFESFDKQKARENAEWNPR
jgi:hypothetical protein